MSYDVYGPYIPVVMLITFIGLVVWVMLPGNKKRFDDASELPFADEQQDAPTGADETRNGRVEK